MNNLHVRNFLSILLTSHIATLSYSLSSPCSSRCEIDRRSAVSRVIGTTVGGISFLASAGNPQPAYAASSIEDRLTTSLLTLPPTSRTSELNGIDHLYYPSWLAGEWAATQTLIDTSNPLGLKFVGGPNGSESIATESVKEQRKQLNVPVELRLRYLNTKFGVAEDRLFNSKQRLDAFAGRSVVSSVEYADVGGSNRNSVLSMGGDNDTPLQTTVVRFKGPAAQKSFMISHGSDVIPDKYEDNKYGAHEVIRSIFALTNTNTAPPVTTDSELIWLFNKVDDEHINAKLRIASYLNAQSDKLYFEAKIQAVSIADYNLVLRRIT